MTLVSDISPSINSGSNESDFLHKRGDMMKNTSANGSMLDELAKRIASSNVRICRLPDKRAICRFVDTLHGLLFPDSIECQGYQKTTDECVKAIASGLEQNRDDLSRLLSPFISDDFRREAVVEDFYEGLPGVYDILLLDAASLYELDPAANSETEVIISYPGFRATAYYRYSHALHQLGIETVPRIITEYAHELTGIDIHPGAQIGQSFAIDHGTGVVIGETAVIGRSVSIYQGVTLGSLSVSKANRHHKRHPTIGDRVTIYANATILGGDTVIGNDSIIGGNTWVTTSVPENSKVLYQR
jgi:serine O-acetyltransferase